MILNGKITISRPSSSDGKEEIVIRIHDSDAGDDILHVKMKLNNFSKVLTGMGHVDCLIETSEDQLKVAGTVREVKEEFVALDKYPDLEECREILKPYCVDGWIPNVSDLRNHHRRALENGVVGQLVRFYRNTPKCD